MTEDKISWCRTCKIYEGKPFLCGNCQWTMYQRYLLEIEIDRKCKEAEEKCL